ncbi:MAG: sulfur carrier protein ThiS [Turneriella sp.]|nr:sulfur carrier protein ThiS [Leptospiraceae bacterium]MCX7633659.1 sulfur carrier protein ThiS [Turneriella sp.]
MMINGEYFDASALGPEPSLRALLSHLALAENRVAIELNGEIIPRAEYGRCQLKPDDVLEIIHYVGGG